MSQRAFEAERLNHDNDFPPTSIESSGRTSTPTLQQPPGAHGNTKSDTAHCWFRKKPMGTGQDLTNLARQPPNHHQITVADPTMPTPCHPGNDKPSKHQEMTMASPVKGGPSNLPHVDLWVTAPITPSSPPIIINNKDEGQTLPLFTFSPSMRNELLNPTKPEAPIAIVSLGESTKGTIQTSTSRNYFTAQSITSSALDDSDWLDDTASIKSLISELSVKGDNTKTREESLYHEMVMSEIRAYETRGYLGNYPSDNSSDDSSCNTNDDADYTYTSDYYDEWDDEERNIYKAELYENALIAAANLMEVLKREEQQGQTWNDEEEQSTNSSKTIYLDCLNHDNLSPIPPPLPHVISTRKRRWHGLKYQHTSLAKNCTWVNPLTCEGSTQNNTHPWYKRTTKSAIQNWCKYSSLQDVISTAMQKAALVRRFFYPRRDVIKWTRKENRVSCPWKLRTLYLEIQSVQESLRRLIDTFNGCFLNTSYNRPWL